MSTQLLSTQQLSTQQKPSRADKTREQLMQAAETLISKEGLENISVRAIVRQAGQKNESALHYHFKNRDGLIQALVGKRMVQLEKRRTRLKEEGLCASAATTLRNACATMVRAPFLLCREDKGFREFLAAFGQKIFNEGLSVTKTIAEQNSSTSDRWLDIAHAYCTHLDKQLLSMRFEDASRFTLLSLSRRARDRLSFNGKASELFINNLADVMAAVLSAPVSEETKICLRKSPAGDRSR